MATVTETVKESLIGTTREPQLSQQAKVTFDQHAIKDEETGELYMTEEQFVDAIAPAGEDYVSLSRALAQGGLHISYSRSRLLLFNKLTEHIITAQDQTGHIRNIIPRRRSTEIW